MEIRYDGEYFYMTTEDCNTLTAKGFTHLAVQGGGLDRVKYASIPGWISDYKNNRFYPELREWDLSDPNSPKKALAVGFDCLQHHSNNFIPGWSLYPGRICFEDGTPLPEKAMEVKDSDKVMY